MRALDRFLQAWRIRRAAPWIPAGARLLDVGCFDSRMFETLGTRIAGGVGLDPLLEAPVRGAGWELRRGRLPGPHDLDGAFAAITMLAVLEHVPDGELDGAARECARLLEPGGRLILTVPAPVVDRILAVLVAARLLDGMSHEQHHGFRPLDAIPLFTGAGLRLVAHRRFQLGLNHLFVFEKRA